MENVTILPKTLKLIHDDPKSQVIVSIQFEIEDTKKKISAAILNFNISKKANNAIRSERKRIVATILKTRKHVERFRRLWKKEKKKKEHSEILYKKSQLSKQETIAKFPPMFRWSFGNLKNSESKRVRFSEALYVLQQMTKLEDMLHS